jgi:FkbM family methyltransferase
LCMTKSWLGCSNTTLHNVAVTEDGRPVKMIWQDPSGTPLTGRTHIASREESANGAPEIAGATIDALCQGVTGRISFLKIDIEGAELGALRGGLSTLRRHRPIVLSEVVDQNLARYGHRSTDIFELFAELQYSPFGLKDGYPTPVGLATAYNDIIFAPRESEFATEVANIRA